MYVILGAQDTRVQWLRGRMLDKGKKVRVMDRQQEIGAICEPGGGRFGPADVLDTGCAEPGVRGSGGSLRSGFRRR